MAEFVLEIPIQIEGTGPKIIRPKFEIDYSVTYPDYPDELVGKKHKLQVIYLNEPRMEAELTIAKSTTVTGKVTSEPVEIKTLELQYVTGKMLSPEGHSPLLINYKANSARIRFFDAGGNLVSDQDISNGFRQADASGNGSLVNTRLPLRSTITLIQFYCKLTLKI